MLSDAFSYLYTVCYYADCRYAECRGANLRTTYVHYIANGGLSLVIVDVDILDQWLVV